MRILMSGGSGMLGQAIVNDPLFTNDKFIILTRKQSIPSQSQRIEYQHWNPTGEDDWQNELGSVDVVINLAGENIGDALWSRKKKEEILSSRVLAGNILARAVTAMQPKPGLFIQASAVGFYGNRGNDLLPETADKGTGFLSDVCQQWEASSQEAEKAGVRRMILRTGVVLSKEAGIFPRMLFPIKFFVGGNLGNGEQFIPWLHVADFVGIVHFLIHRENVSGVFNICAPPLSYKEIGRKLAKIYQRPYWLTVPDFALKVLLGEMSTLVLDSQRVQPQRLQQLNYSYRYENVEDALLSFA